MLASRALCDLDLAVNLMLYSIFKKLDLGYLRPTSISFQFTGHSVKYTLGILEDVFIKVGDFYVLMDFVIPDMAKDAHTQIILGRPFSTTTCYKINVKEDRLTFDVG